MMKLHSRMSEYQYCFSYPNDDYFKTVYEEQLAYRTKRREKEHSHYMFCWDSENDSETVELSPKDELSTTSTNSNRSSNSEKMEGDEMKCDTVEPLQLEFIDENADPQVEQCNAKPSKKFHVEKPSSRQKSSERPPFLSYGWADEQIETGRKKTHNIHAPQKTVYPGALKRSNYLKLEKAKQKQKKEKRTASAVTIPLYQKPSDSSGWLSEYQRCYSRQSSSRQSSRPTTSSHGKRDTGIVTRRGATPVYRPR